MKKLFLFFFGIMCTLFLFAQINYKVVTEHVTDNTSLIHYKIDTPIESVKSGEYEFSIQTPMQFTSYVIGWTCEADNVSATDFTVLFRSHKPGYGWTEMLEDEGYVNPDDTKAKIYHTDLLFGRDELLHDSINFIIRPPKGIEISGVHLILMDISQTVDLKRKYNFENYKTSSCLEFPQIIPRSEWCGNYVDCHNPPNSPGPIEPSHIIVHYGYSPETYTDSYAVVRSYWNFHVNTRGWWDIGYNYLFDKYGNFFQGRHNVNLPYTNVFGVHAGTPTNQYSVGICHLGNTDVTLPTPEQIEKSTDFMAWWFDYFNIDPLSYASIPNNSSQWISMPRIIGHKDVGSTSCPGNVLYNMLPSFITQCAEKISNCSTNDICLGSSTGTMTLSGHVGNIIRWQKRHNSGAWTNISNSSTTYEETPSSVGVWEYRAEVKSGTCSSVFSAIKSITVNSGSVGGIVNGSNSTIDIGSPTGVMTLSGHTGLVIRWQKRLNSGTWTNISNTNTTYSEIPSSAGVWEYRAEIKNENCPSVYSSTHTITVIDLPPSSSITVTYTGGDIPTDRNFSSVGGSSSCPGSLTVNIPSGAIISSVDVEYSMTALNSGWRSEQRSRLYCVTTGIGESQLYQGSGTGGTFNYSRTGLDIANGATGQVVFQLHAGRSWGGTGCNTTYNKVDNNTWKLTVHLENTAPSGAGDVVGNVTELCLGSSTGTMTLSGHIGSIVRWQKRHNSGAWINISNTNTTYTEYPSLVGNWDYRAVINNNNNILYSESHSINVISSVGGSISGNNSSIILGNSTGNMTLSGHLGTVIRWQKRFNSGAWTNISHSNTTYSDTPSLIGVWEYRAEVKNGNCSSVYSTVYSITVNEIPPSSSISVTYFSGDIPTDRSFTTISGSSSCPGQLIVNLPSGTEVTGVDVEYSISTVSSGWQSDQRSRLYCVTTATGESQVYSGAGTGGTFNYSRTGLNIANGATGQIVFQLHAGRTFGGSGCNTAYNKVDNNTWKLTVHYEGTNKQSEIEDISELFELNKSKLPPDINIYPNPTKGLVNIDYNNIIINKIKVYDILGKIILNEYVSSNKSFILDIDNYTDGLYFIKLYSEDDIYVHKIVLSR